MPGFNQNGPMGQGPMSGKGFGVCGTEGQSTGMGGRGRRAGAGCRTGFNWNQRDNRFGGQGQGQGQGQGSGRMNRPGWSSVEESVSSPDLDALRAEYMQAQKNLTELKERIDALEKSAGTPSGDGSQSAGY